ncbi:hypothetical protein AJ79_08992 [Helicocarpus griseus UAMH5409]|uniref:Aminoglycoside phosphotransferase domain-containing protein n=1 Tax=Helicocarpus griseus UAMH5409 TaxID=1447875 RepID=A0A2B7WNF8_9EURO|nr:hypothetical protein AJ79_08992 [Helicocarpus griseus UAMH5409]
MKITNVQPQQVAFHQELHRNENAVVLVSVSGFRCVMKVVSGIHPPHRALWMDGENPHHDYPHRARIHQREATAYQKLQACGVTQKGYVPQFYGSVQGLEPKLWRPHLDMFMDDINLPSAIFIEYIPGLRQLHLDTRFVDAIKAVTAALVMHNDLTARNFFMIAPGDPERVILLYFDRARTWDKDTLTARQQEWLHEDVQIVEDLGRLLEIDVAEGPPQRFLHLLLHSNPERHGFA